MKVQIFYSGHLKLDASLDERSKICQRLNRLKLQNDKSLYPNTADNDGPFNRSLRQILGTLHQPHTTDKMFYQVRMYTRIIANGEIRCE